MEFGASPLPSLGLRIFVSPETFPTVTQRLLPPPLEPLSCHSMGQPREIAVDLRPWFSGWREVVSSPWVSVRSQVASGSAVASSWTKDTAAKTSILETGLEDCRKAWFCGEMKKHSACLEGLITIYWIAWKRPNLPVFLLPHGQNGDLPLWASYSFSVR